MHPANGVLRLRDRVALSLPGPSPLRSWTLAMHPYVTVRLVFLAGLTWMVAVITLLMALSRRGRVHKGVTRLRSNRRSGRRSPDL